MSAPTRRSERTSAAAVADSDSVKPESKSAEQRNKKKKIQKPLNCVLRKLKEKAASFFWSEIDLWLSKVFLLKK